MGCMYVIHVSMNSYCQCDQFGKIKFLNVIFYFVATCEGNSPRSIY